MGGIPPLLTTPTFDYLNVGVSCKDVHVGGIFVFFCNKKTLLEGTHFSKKGNPAHVPRQQVAVMSTDHGPTMVPEQSVTGTPPPSIPTMAT